MPKNDVEPAEVSRIADLALGFDPDPHFARGDARDIMLQVLRTSADWSKFNEQQQRDLNAAVNDAAETIVAKLVKALASEGRDAVRCKLEQATIKDDGVKLALTTMPDAETLSLLTGMVGGHVQLVAADASDHDGERAPAQVDKDQPDMPLESGTDDLATAGDDVARDVELQD